MFTRRNIRYLLLYCRIGSLEMTERQAGKRKELYCRIGSLERHHKGADVKLCLYCRIGSLEKLISLVDI